MISQTLGAQKEPQQQNIASVSGGHRENWGESNMADASPRTDTSTDVETDDKNQRVMSLVFIILCIAAKKLVSEILLINDVSDYPCTFLDLKPIVSFSN